MNKWQIYVLKKCIEYLAMLDNSSKSVAMASPFTCLHELCKYVCKTSVGAGSVLYHYTTELDEHGMCI
jgi:hypothetical protein